MRDELCLVKDKDIDGTRVYCFHCKSVQGFSYSYTNHIYLYECMKNEYMIWTKWFRFDCIMITRWLMFDEVWLWLCVCCATDIFEKEQDLHCQAPFWNHAWNRLWLDRLSNKFWNWKEIVDFLWMSCLPRMKTKLKNCLFWFTKKLVSNGYLLLYLYLWRF